MNTEEKEIEKLEEFEDIKLEDHPKYLPIGSVVMLKDASKRLMIIGFCCGDEENEDIVYDYCGCLFPEGNVGEVTNLVFNHDQIEKIYDLGYCDEEVRKYIEELTKEI